MDKIWEYEDKFGAQLPWASADLEILERLADEAIKRNKPLEDQELVDAGAVPAEYFEGITHF